MTLSAYANVGIGAKLWIGPDSTNTTGIWPVSAAAFNSATWTQVAEVRSFSWDGECGEGEVTPMDGTGHRQFLPTYLAATASASLNWIPESATGSELAMTQYQARRVSSWVMQVPTRNGSNATSTDETAFLGFLTGFRPNVEGDGPQTVDLTWRVADSTLA